MSGLDLYLSQRTLALLLVYGAFTGFGLGALYDGLRLLRMILGESLDGTPPGGMPLGGMPPGGAGKRSVPLQMLLFAEDILFMTAATVAFILLCYYANDGQIRAPAAVGMCSGFFVYRHTLSRPLLRLAYGCIRLVKRFLILAARLLTAPLRALWTVTAGRWLRERRERLTEKRIQRMTEQAARGFDLLEENGKYPPKAE